MYAIGRFLWGLMNWRVSSRHLAGRGRALVGVENKATRLGQSARVCVCVCVFPDQMKFVLQMRMYKKLEGGL